MFQRALAVALLALAAVPFAPSAALAGHGHGDGQATPTLQQFIGLVRGYDAATIRRTFPAYNTGIFERVFGSGAPIPLASPADQHIFEDQVVLTPAGRVIDVGHVVTGLEAGGPLPPSAMAVQNASGCSMLGAVTWSGDVGQALIDFLAGSGSISAAAAYDASAPSEDLLGDVDGYVLGTDLKGQPADVAAILTREYLDGDLEQTRFGRFYEALGPDPADAAAREIICYARAFAAASGVMVTPAAVADAAPYFIERFLTELAAGFE